MKSLKPLLVLPICVGMFLIIVSWLRGDIIDPDYWFHLELSRLWNLSGPPKTLPRILGLPWAKDFADKEFLYHLLTAAAYRVFGEPGLRLLTYTTGAVTLWLLASLTSWIPSKRSQGSSKSAFILLILVASQTQWMGRMALVRPHTVAVLLFSLSLIFIGQLVVPARRELEKNDPLRWRMALVSLGLLFPLFYHAFYVLWVPLLLLALLVPSERRWVAACGGASLLGIALHPNPGGLLQMTWAHVQVGTLQTPLPHHLIPMEFFGPGLPISLSHHFWFWGLVLATLLPDLLPALTGQKDWEWDPKRIPLITWLGAGTSLAFYLLYLRNFRALEYLVPSLCLWTFAWLDQKRPLPPLQHLGSALPALVILSGFFVPLKYDLRADYDKLLRYLQAVVSALSRVPEQDSSPIFNCNWGTGAQVMGVRASNPFVDLLDPYFLLKSNPKLYELREKLVEGQMIHPSLAIHQTLKANYILCKDGILNLQLSLDPRFERLFPDHQTFQIDLKKGVVGDTTISLFRFHPRHERAFQRGEELNPTWFPTLSNPKLAGGISFLGFPAQSSDATVPRAQRVEAGCAQNSFQVKDSWRGVKYLTLSTPGATQITHLRKNRIIQRHEIRGETQSVRGVGQMMIFSAALAPNDELRFKVCAPRDFMPPQAPAGMALPWVLSAWTEGERTDACQTKQNNDRALNEPEFLDLIHASFPRLPHYLCAGGSANSG